MPRHISDLVVKIVKATQQGQHWYDADVDWDVLDRVHTGATWQIRLNRPVLRRCGFMSNYFDHLLYKIYNESFEWQSEQRFQVQLNRSPQRCSSQSIA